MVACTLGNMAHDQEGSLCCYSSYHDARPPFRHMQADLFCNDACMLNSLAKGKIIQSS